MSLGNREDPVRPSTEKHCSRHRSKKLTRRYEAIENGLAELNDPNLKGRIVELKRIRDGARADVERAEARDSRGAEITPETLLRFAVLRGKVCATTTGPSAGAMSKRSSSGLKWERTKSYSEDRPYASSRRLRRPEESAEWNLRGSEFAVSYGIGSPSCPPIELFALLRALSFAGSLRKLGT
jgi:hypothetical protein